MNEEQLTKELEDRKDEEILDNLVIEVSGDIATRINNRGVKAQMEFVLTEIGERGLEIMEALLKE